MKENNNTRTKSLLKQQLADKVEMCLNIQKKGRPGPQTQKIIIQHRWRVKQRNPNHFRSQSGHSEQDDPGGLRPQKQLDPQLEQEDPHLRTGCSKYSLSRPRSLPPPRSVSVMTSSYLNRFPLPRPLAFRKKCWRREHGLQDLRSQSPLPGLRCHPSHGSLSQDSSPP